MRRAARTPLEPPVQGVDIANVDSAQIRRAGKDLLSLELMDARNHSLRWAAAFENAPGEAVLRSSACAGLHPPLWELGRIGWFQEHWIARNVQRQRGEHGDATQPKLASILPQADALFEPSRSLQADRDAAALPDPQTIRQYLVDTLETTLVMVRRPRPLFTSDGMVVVRLRPVAAVLPAR